MSRHKELFNLMHMLDLDEIPYAIATVIKVFGSSSGKVGDKALFDQNGKRLEGYIGGGCIENRVSETAKEYDMPYNSNRTFLDAIKVHAQMIYKLGNMEQKFA